MRLIQLATLDTERMMPREPSGKKNGPGNIMPPPPADACILQIIAANQVNIIVAGINFTTHWINALTLTNIPVPSIFPVNPAKLQYTISPGSPPQGYCRTIPIRVTSSNFPTILDRKAFSWGSNENWIQETFWDSNFNMLYLTVDPLSANAQTRQGRVFFSPFKICGLGMSFNNYFDIIQGPEI